MQIVILLLILFFGLWLVSWFIAKVFLTFFAIDEHIKLLHKDIRELNENKPMKGK